MIPSRYKKIDTGENYSDGSAKIITMGVKVFLYHVERQATGQPWDMPQGCYHMGSLSANTHAGADIIDSSHFAANQRLRDIKDFGGFGWIRDERDSPDFAEPNWHIHWGIKNSRKMDPSAKAQLGSYLRGCNGLIGDAHDRYEYRTNRRFNYRRAYKTMIAEQERAAFDARMDRAERILKTTKKGSPLYTAILKFILRFRGKPKANH